MNNLTKKNLTKLAALSGTVFFGTGLAQATTIPATISSTLTVSTDSHLTSNVSCTVTGAPCIKFGAPGIKLNLNGFIITGNGGRNTCTLNFTDTGIDTNLQNNVFIQGPGLVRRFNFVDIVVSGNNSSVEGVAITSSCLEGIRVFGSRNEVEGNSISRAGLDNSLVGHFAAGIFVAAPGGNNRILNNEVVGAGTYPIISGQGGFGIFVGEPGSPSKNNLIQGNNASGNPGSGIFISLGSVGNKVRHNQALGAGSPDHDIFDANALPANDYDNNLCEVSLIGPSPGQDICKLPNIAGHRNGPVDHN
ncbi:MAG: right-handed parallel beta-helix repeat-containing protein [Methylocella sp.]